MCSCYDCTGRRNDWLHFAVAKRIGVCGDINVVINVGAFKFDNFRWRMMIVTIVIIIVRMQRRTFDGTIIVWFRFYDNTVGEKIP